MRRLLDNFLEDLPVASRLMQDLLEGQPYMSAMAALALLLLPATLVLFLGGVKARSRQRALSIAAVLVGAGLLPTVLGFVSYFLSRRGVEALVRSSTIAPDDAGFVRELSLAESLVPIEYGLGLAILPVVVGLVLLGLGLSRRIAMPPPAPGSTAGSAPSTPESG